MCAGRDSSASYLDGVVCVAGLEQRRNRLGCSSMGTEQGEEGGRARGPGIQGDRGAGTLQPI